MQGRRRVLRTELLLRGMIHNLGGCLVAMSDELSLMPVREFQSAVVPSLIMFLRNQSVYIAIWRTCSARLTICCAAYERSGSEFRDTKRSLAYTMIDTTWFVPAL
jgi:hypothetical protein